MSSDPTTHTDGGAQSSSDLEEALEAAGAEQVYLLTVSGCDFCEAMKESLSDWIADGVVETVDVEDDEKAVDIMDGVEEDLGVPSLVAETHDGEYIVYQ